MKKIVVDRRSTRIVLNMTKTVMDLNDLSRLTQTLPDLSRLSHAYVRDVNSNSPHFKIVLNHGLNVHTSPKLVVSLSVELRSILFGDQAFQLIKDVMSKCDPDHV